MGNVLRGITFVDLTPTYLRFTKLIFCNEDWKRKVGVNFGSKIERPLQKRSLAQKHAFYNIIGLLLLFDIGVHQVIKHITKRAINNIAIVEDARQRRRAINGSVQQQQRHRCTN